MSSPALAAEDLSVALGGVGILRGVSLEVAPGEVVGVLGPSGAGKSTLFRALSGELRVDRGSVRLGGVDVTREPLWKRARLGLGYVPQTPSVLFDLDVEANLEAFGRITRSAKPAQTRAAEVDLEGRLEIRARDLSGGERRRLELARALTAEPRVLLCDEPLAGVDPTGAQRIGRILRARAEAQMAVLVADHRVSEALAFCDRVLLLLDGRVEVASTPAEFLEHPAVRRRYLG
ncbi:MAG: ATP-binding cassette domain-containing protein [Myxococcales bacterium]|nr:ATP-binding cassette domain-containing protein [Myxococcales bacterium]